MPDGSSAATQDRESGAAAPPPERVVREFLRALERLDLDAAMALAAPEIVYQNVPLPPARGAAATRRVLAMMMRPGTGFEARMHNLATEGPIVLTERTDVLKAGRFEAKF
jgi:limonene-1,2-epoxide hydrolase